ncbi:glycoside hydrolase family 2 TIM barrel-domain containing protein, partial [Streptomyces sp. NPDC047981]|uniref:glycoside hydrolase family 2 protein n=1 Tax=Streptomyces sp. NPDC047981 TaxID=3154610 RepID=UPI0034341D8E
MPVPGNWETRDDYNTYNGVAWYSRNFTVANVGNADSRYWLNIDACYWECHVWVNGTPVKSLKLSDNSPAGEDGTDLSWSPSDTHWGGYTQFQLDVTSAIRTSGTNTVVVKADNTYKQGAWWPWGGLSRDVSLITTEALSVTRQEITATPDLTDGTASITSKVFVRNTGTTDRQITVKGSITSAATGADVPGGTALTGNATVPAGETVPVTLQADLNANTFSLWQTDDPDLYRLGVSLAADSAPGTVINGISDTFGIRSIKVSGTNILLNGEKLKMAGANRTAEDPVNGNAEPVAQVRHDLDRMKAAGMGLTRIMHFAQATEVLDYADRIGMLLIGETPIWGSAADLSPANTLRLKQQMAEQVYKDFNHPSLFAWSVGNELDSHQADGLLYGEKMADFSRNIDPTRLVTLANNKINEPSKVTAGSQDATKFMDFASINVYYDFGGGVTHTRSLYPNKPIFISEYSSDSPSDGYWKAPKESTDATTTNVTTARSAFANKDYVFGWSQWTYNDYRSTYATSSTNKVRGFGAVDVWGRPKAAYGTMRAGNAPVTSLALSTPQTQDSNSVAQVTVTPRGPLATDGPSWKLSGYKVAVRATDANGAVTGGTVTDLPEIDPGDAAVQVPVSWKYSDSAATLTITLLSPVGYEEAVKTVDLKAPAKPQIVGTAVANGSVRVRYADAVDGLKHTVKAVAPNGTVAATKTTTEPFADLTGLTNGTAYTVSVTTDNGAGSSEAASVSLTPTGTLPAGPNPLVVTPVDEGLVLGFSQNASGTPEFQVTVTDTATGTQVKDYRTTNRPGTRVEGLTPGHTYSLQIRQVAADGSPATAWSEKVEGTVPTSSQAPALKVKGTIGGATSGGIAVVPAPGTIRYELTVNNGKPFQVNRAA